ncbi:hypothetical protein EJB05_35024, partial [Eragrostis curvula]
MPNWTPVYETTAFELSSFAEILRCFAHYLGFHGDPKYVVSSAPLNHYLLEYSAEVTLVPSTPLEAPLKFYGRGTTGPMAIREAAYIAITELHSRYAIGDALFRYYSFRVGADHENNFIPPREDESPMVRLLARLVEAMDECIGRLDEADKLVELGCFHTGGAQLLWSVSIIARTSS